MQVPPTRQAPGYVAKGKPAKPDEALLVHWTGGQPASADRLSGHLSVMTRGRADVPGPLYRDGVDPWGTLWLVCGRAVKANSTGRIDVTRWERLLADRPPLRPSDAQPARTTTANNRIHAIAIMWDGNPHNLTLEQWRTVIWRCAWWADDTGHDPATRMTTHDELSGWRKVDIASVIDMDGAREQTDRLRRRNQRPGQIPFRPGALTAPPPTLRKGTNSALVVMLRRQLARWNIDAATSGDPHRFGKILDTAVRRFQRNAGLVADGIVGPKTWAALRTLRPHDVTTLVADAEPKAKPKPKPKTERRPAAAPPEIAPFSPAEVDWLDARYRSK